MFGLPTIHNVWLSDVTPECSFVEVLGYDRNGRWAYVIVVHLASTGYVSAPVVD